MDESLVLKRLLDEAESPTPGGNEADPKPRKRQQQFGPSKTTTLESHLLESAILRYRDLDSSKGEIRLVYWPMDGFESSVSEVGDPDEPESMDLTAERAIWCNLEYFSLKEAPSFVAISYVWGNSENNEHIRVNGCTFPVTTNLYRVFQEIRLFRRFKRQEERGVAEDNEGKRVRIASEGIDAEQEYFWIDALCINKCNLEERAAQVPRMGEIYYKAQVWIFPGLPIQGTLPILMGLKKLQEQGTKETMDEDDWSSIHKFFSAPWFQRVWVIQEFVLGLNHETVVFSGCVPIRVVQLLRATQILRSVRTFPMDTDKSNALRQGLREFTTLFSVLFILELKDPLERLLALLWNFRDRLATDPRDKIYSVLGFLDYNLPTKAGPGRPCVFPEASIMPELLISYEPTVDSEDAYASFVQAFVNRTKSLNILCACQGKSSFRRSWVADWSMPWCSVSMIRNKYLFTPEDNPDETDKKVFNASKDSRCCATFSEDGFEIHVRGLRWSRIWNTIVPPDSPGENELWDEATYDLKEACRRKISEAYGEFDRDKFLVAMCAGYKSLNRKEALARDISYFTLGAPEEWHKLINEPVAYEVELDSNGIDWWSDDVRSDEHSGEFFCHILRARMTQMFWGRNIFISDSGHYGLVPEHAKEGDLICFLYGCDVPLVLREGDHFILIGESYVEGIMDGEAMDAWKKGELDEEVFDIH